MTKKKKIQNNQTLYPQVKMLLEIQNDNKNLNKKSVN